MILSGIDHKDQDHPNPERAHGTTYLVIKPPCYYDGRRLTFLRKKITTHNIHLSNKRWSTISRHDHGSGTRLSSSTSKRTLYPLTRKLYVCPEPDRIKPIPFIFHDLLNTKLVVNDWPSSKSLWFKLISQWLKRKKTKWAASAKKSGTT